MDLEKFKKAFVGFKMPEMPRIQSPIMPEIDYEALKDIESPFPEIIEKLDQNNVQLRTANEKLVDVLIAQHNSSKKTSIANLVLAVLVFGVTAYGIYSGQQSQKTQGQLLEQVLERNSTITELERRLTISESELNALRIEHQQLQQTLNELSLPTVKENEKE